MLKAERHKKILDTLDEKGAVTISGLCAALRVSRATVRRDLVELDNDDLLERSHGGAVSIAKPSMADIPLALRQHIRKEEKIRIAEAAVAYIREGNTIYLGAGTTTREVAAKLNKFRQLTVLTNDIAVAMAVSATENQLIVAGGVLKKSSMTLLGNYTEHMLNELHVDIAILSVDAVDPEHGFMDYNTDEVKVKRLMIQNAEKCVMLCDHSKFRKAALVKVCPPSDVDLLITGAALDPDYRQKLANCDVQVCDVQVCDVQVIED